MSGPVVLGARIVLGGVFVYSGAVKIADPIAFAMAIGNYKLLPAGAANLTAAVLPWLEVLAGLSVLTGLFRRGGALLISGMLVAFMAAVATALARGLHIECGCFSVAGGREVGLTLLAEDLILLALALVVLLRTPPTTSRGGP